MPSRAELRGRIEAVLRAVSIVTLAWLLWLSLDRGRVDTVVSAGSSNLGSALRSWTQAGVAPDRINVAVDTTPSPRERDWLAALAGAGSDVAWSGNLPAIAVSTQPIVSPRGGIAVLTAAPSGTAVRLTDELGSLDTAESRGGGARFVLPAASGFVSANTGKSGATTGMPGRLVIRKVLVLGNAGWESKFVIAALEEDGWAVDASIYVAPGISVTQGSALPIDTSHYSAIVAVDGAAGSRASEIARYVANGGGLVIAGNAASLDGFSQVRAGVPGRRAAPTALGTGAGQTTLRSLGVIPVTGLKADAIPLERRDAMTITAARRHVSGRVLQQGYMETWRWRMSGGDESMGDHRDFWTRAVGSVAYAPRVAVVATDSLDSAPIAGLVDALGPSAPVSGPSLASAASSISLSWLAALAVLSLLGEWASRRFGGLR
ncbi:MAG: hypothetical protein M3R07_12555 [Gemmatimonadota bacterium]|nr:hypothetical protein [Gemmatimonadota bacterium]